MMIPIITYSLDKLVLNTLAITLNVLAILRIHGMNIYKICESKVHCAMHCLYKQLQTVKM